MDIESQARASPREFHKWVPVVSVIISSCSFLFALSVLYPWHLELSNEFKHMQAACLQREGH